MNKIDISTPSTTVLSQYPGYNAADQYLTQIGTFTIWVDTTLSGTANIVLPSVSAFRLRAANFKIFDVAGQAGTNNVIVSFEDGALVNGADSITLNTNYGNVQVQLQDGEWFANLNGTGGGGGGITGANNGLSVSGGTVVQLGSVVGAPLIQNSIVTGLQTYPLSFQSTDGTFYVAAGNLAAAPYNLAINSYAVSTSTTLQGLSLSMTQNKSIILQNIDTAASASREISMISSSAGIGSFPTGGIALSNSAVPNYTSSISLRQEALVVSESVVLQISNSALGGGGNYINRLTVSQTLLVGQKSQQNNSLNPINGWAIQNGLNTTTAPSATGVSAIYFGCTSNLADSSIDLTSGSVLYLSSAGLQFIVSNVAKFTISPTGAVTMVLPTSAGASGTLWNDTSGTYGPSVVRVAP